MKYLYTLLIILFPLSGIFAQSSNVFTIRGKVTDKNGTPLSFVYVVVDSSSIYAETDSSGRYIIKNVPEGIHKVTIQFLGFKTQSKAITGRKDELLSLNFSLEEDILSMDEVTIIAESEKEKLENSAKAVHVIETKEAKLKSADMGDVLAQTQGVSVRRSGGLGSNTRFSLNGLTGDQVRFFLDGIPLEFSGYTFGISTVPVNNIDRIEIYKGVVPIQFGADALGGAVNIVSPKVYYGLSGSLSYQTGSFGIHRATLDVKYLDDSTDLFVSGGGFYDYAKNNYKVDVKVANDKGKLTPTTVRRFHDKYNAKGINLTLGVKNKKWAKELSLKGFYSDYAKDVQHNLTMEGIPYGDVMTFRKSSGINLTYIKNFGKKISLNTTAGFSFNERQFIDTSHCVYDWYGDCLLRRNNPGEIIGNVTSAASHQYTWDRNYFARLLGAWEISANHVMRFSIAPTYTYRTGKEEYTNTYDPDAAKRYMLNWVNGIEYELNALASKLQNIFFVKDYLQNIRLEETMPNLPQALITQRQVHHYGFGNSTRYQLAPRANVKVSYEYATRLPRPDELFGDGQFIANNLDLMPERSHNVNLEFTYKNNYEAKSKWYVQPNFFLRKINNLIFLQLGATDRENIYANVANTVSTGGEISLGWISSKERIQATLNSTYQYYYNNSTEGEFKSFRYDRMPNMPYFFTNSSISYSFKNMIKKNDRLSPFWNMRYVYRFYSSWESAGLKESKEIIPDQQIHGVGITYQLEYHKLNWALTGEVQNLLNKKVYDFYGVQKPGRAYNIKLTLQF